MLQVTVTTKAGATEYEVTANQFESLQEGFEYWEGLGENADEVCLGIVNTAMLQNAKQGDKNDVRKALASHGEGSDELDEAIVKHQASAAKYVIGKPRGGRLADGSTKTEVKDRASSGAENPEALAEMNAIFAKYGAK